ncbi:MAG: biopolymer transporter ExbD [Myxococcota bacterium]
MNITPLVDVVLVLLIIFMVVTPAIAEGEAVQLPEVIHAKKASGTSLEVTLAANGTVLVAQQPVATDALSATLAAWQRQNPEGFVLLNADEKLPYGDVRRTFRSMQALGLKGLSLKVLQKSGPTEGSP